LRKEVGGVPLALLELSITTTRRDSHGDERSSTTTQTAAYYHSPHLFFPRFTLRPADLTMKLISGVTGLESLHLPDASEFARQYFVLANDPPGARLLLDANVRAWLMARPGLHIDSGGSGVLVYRAGEALDPNVFESFMTD